MRVIFSGIDGVLHPRHAAAVAYDEVPERLFEWVDIVESLLAPHDDVFLVIHGEYGYEWTDAELCSALRSLAGRFMGSVPKGPRYPSILEWLGRNPSVTSCRILDDEPKQFPAPPPDELLLCHPETGIYEWKVRRQLQRWLHGV